VQHSSWAERLELVGDDDRLVGSAGALPLRLLAERAGLRAGLSAAMTRRGFTPVYDRGQLLVDLAVTQLLGGEAISDFQGLRHLAPVIGPIPSNPTVWRAMAEVGQLELARITAAVTVFRRHWWGLLAARPAGFPWLRVAGRPGFRSCGRFSGMIASVDAGQDVARWSAGPKSLAARLRPIW